jgi:hypothetical protein
VASHPQACFVAGRHLPFAEMRFDTAHDRVGGAGEAVGDQPAGAFRNPKSHQQNRKSNGRPDQKSKPPAECWIDDGGVEKDEGTARTKRCSDPEAAVDQEVGPAAEPCRNKLLDCRIDGSVFAADTAACQEPE